MLERVVVVRVAVRFAPWVVRSMGVLVMLVVHVDVLVIHCVVAVQMGVPLAQERRYARRHIAARGICRAIPERLALRERPTKTEERQQHPNQVDRRAPAPRSRLEAQRGPHAHQQHQWSIGLRTDDGEDPRQRERRQQERQGGRG